MAKLATLGQNAHQLTDCSEVIPVPKKAKSNVATFPAGKSIKDIEASVCLFYRNALIAEY